MHHRLHITNIALVCALLLLGGTRLRGDEPPPAEMQRTQTNSTPSFSFYFENDAFAGEDRHYTNGIKFSWLSGDLVTWGQTGWRKTLVEHLPFVNRPDAQKNFSFSIGQNIYTPQDITRVPPDPTDRPYAGWLYTEFSFASRTPKLIDTLSIQLGIVGPHSYAEQAQKNTHDLIDSTDPLGWDYQLKDELGVNVIFERKVRLYAQALHDTLGVDVVPHIGASIGNVQTYANIGGTARFGFNLPNNFGIDLIGPANAGNSPVEGHNQHLGQRGDSSVFVFVGIDGRAIARDIFLDGNTFRDSRSVPKNAFVYDAYYGAGFLLGRWQVTYTAVLRSREFKRQDRKNYFGSFAVSRIW